MERGYIKLWRKCLESGLLQNGPAWQLFGYYLLKASYKQTTQIVSGRIVHLSAGQLVSGRTKAAHDLDLSEQQIRTAQKLLESLEIVTSESTNRFTVITIINWMAYQHEQPADNQQDNQQPTSSQPASNHKQECKNKNKNINTPPPTPPQGGVCELVENPAEPKKRSKPETPQCPYGQMFDLYRELLPDQPFDPVWVHDDRVKAKVRTLWQFFFKRISLRAKADEKPPDMSFEAGMRYAHSFFSSAGRDEFFAGKEWYSLLWLCSPANATKVISRAKAKPREDAQ